MSFRVLFSPSLLLLLTISACAKAKLEPNAIATQKDYEKSIVEEERDRGGDDAAQVPPEAQAQYNFIRGRMALNEEKYTEALDYFRESARLEKGPAPTLRKNLAQLYVRLGRIDDALKEVDFALKQSPNDIELLQLRAGILATKKDTTAAVAAYEKIIEQSPPEHEDSFVLMASLYAQEGKLPEAKTVLNRLIARNPKSFFGYYYLGRISEAAGDATGAEAHYEKALEINPEADSVNLDLARVYGVQKRYKEAIELCEKVVRENPKNAAARTLLAQLLMGDNRVDKAIKEFEALGSLEKDPSETRLKIALIKLQRRDLEGAATELNLILSQHPENPAARYYLSSAYAGLQRVQDAISEIRKIDETQPYFLESRILAAVMLQQEKRFSEGVVFMQEALKQKPQEVKLLTLLASLQHGAGDIEGALVTMKKVIDLEPQKGGNYFSYGVFLGEAGKKGDAMLGMRKAIELEPKNANALNYLGYSLAEKGENLAEAEKLIRQALTLDKNNGYFLDSLGWLYYQQGKFKDATRELEKAVKIIATDAVILEHYALSLVKTNDKKKALETVEKALLHVAESDDKEVGERLKKLRSELQSK